MAVLILHSFKELGRGSKTPRAPPWFVLSEFTRLNSALGCPPEQRGTEGHPGSSWQSLTDTKAEPPPSYQLGSVTGLLRAQPPWRENNPHTLPQPHPKTVLLHPSLQRVSQNTTRAFW